MTEMQTQTSGKLRGLIGDSQRHRDEFRPEVTSFYTGLISWSIIEGDLGFRALLSEDLLPGQASTAPKWKFPGGDGEAHEFWQEAAEREWSEEVMRDKSKVMLDFEKTVMVYEQHLPDENFSGGQHEKRFYLFKENEALTGFKGDMHFRTSPMRETETDKNGKPRKGGLLYPSQVIRVPTLCQLMKQTNTWSHRRALLYATRVLVNRSPDLAQSVDPDFRRFVLSDTSFWNHK